MQHSAVTVCLQITNGSCTPKQAASRFGFQQYLADVIRLVSGLSVQRMLRCPQQVTIISHMITAHSLLCGADLVGCDLAVYILVHNPRGFDMHHGGVNKGLQMHAGSFKSRLGIAEGAVLFSYACCWV